MKQRKPVKILALALALLFLAGCMARDETRSFAEEHDAFETRLMQKKTDDNPLYTPPEGVFDLVYYPSRAGDLAAYISSDPGDGQKHPLMIWLVGGWENSIDDTPFCYPQWENDQTGSAFWQSGILTMYPSFRGGNGNPGLYEDFFGEVDDIVSALEYAASLPYVDPDRIYLGGHSTGGTRALLAAEYTDRFRAVFSFGAVGEVESYNRDFVFDAGDAQECRMRSPIEWLDQIRTPTFLIEGEGKSGTGNAASLQKIDKRSENENIHCYLVNGADHFSVLGPVTWMLAQKILDDTGASSNISITQAELEAAMEQPPVIPLPAMVRNGVEGGLELSFESPYIWQAQDNSQDYLEVCLYSSYMEDNIWDQSVLYFSTFSVVPEDVPEEGGLVLAARNLEELGYTVTQAVIGGQDAVAAEGTVNSNGETYRNLYALLEKDGSYAEFDFFVPARYGETADPLFAAILDSVTFSE